MEPQQVYLSLLGNWKKNKMAAPLPVDQVITLIESLPLKEALAVLVANQIYGFSKEGYHKIKEVIIRKQNEGRYAFVPNKDEANMLNQFSSNPEYQQIVLLIPKYKYVDFIRTGLLIKELNSKEGPTGSERVKDIKVQVTRRPNGQKLLKIANLITTPFFSIILQHMYNLKLKSYSTEDLEEKFEEMVDDWLNSSLLLKSDQRVEIVREFCEKQIKNEKRQFFILGMKTVADTVEREINQLIKEEFFDQSGYNYDIKKKDEPLRIEVTVFTKTEL